MGSAIEFRVTGRRSRRASSTRAAAPSAPPEPAAPALGPADRLVRLGCGRSKRTEEAEVAERRAAAVVGNRDQLAAAGVHLESGWRTSEEPFVEETVELELETDLGVPVAVDRARELRIADNVTGGRADEEVRLADDLAFLAVERSEEHTSELQSHHDLVCRL